MSLSHVFHYSWANIVFLLEAESLYLFRSLIWTLLSLILACNNNITFVCYFIVFSSEFIMHLTWLLSFPLKRIGQVLPPFCKRRDFSSRRLEVFLGLTDLMGVRTYLMDTLGQYSWHNKRKLFIFVYRLLLTGRRGDAF